MLNKSVSDKDVVTDIKAFKQLLTCWCELTSIFRTFIWNLIRVFQSPREYTHFPFSHSLQFVAALWSTVLKCMFEPDQLLHGWNDLEFTTHSQVCSLLSIALLFPSVEVITWKSLDTLLNALFAYLSSCKQMVLLFDILWDIVFLVFSFPGSSPSATEPFLLHSVILFCTTSSTTLSFLSSFFVSAVSNKDILRFIFFISITDILRFRVCSRLYALIGMFVGLDDVSVFLWRGKLNGFLFSCSICSCWKLNPPLPFIMSLVSGLILLAGFTCAVGDFFLVFRTCLSLSVLLGDFPLFFVYFILCSVLSTVFSSNCIGMNFSFSVIGAESFLSWSLPPTSFFSDARVLILFSLPLLAKLSGSNVEVDMFCSFEVEGTIFVVLRLTVPLFVGFDWNPDITFFEFSSLSTFPFAFALFIPFAISSPERSMIIINSAHFYVSKWDFGIQYMCD